MHKQPMGKQLCSNHKPTAVADWAPIRGLSEQQQCKLGVPADQSALRMYPGHIPGWGAKAAGAGAFAEGACWTCCNNNMD